MSEKVSVIIRTGVSRAGCLIQSIDSVFAQNYKNIEIVIVENGSNNLQKLLEAKYTDTTQLRYFNLKEANRCAAGNIGLTVATGAFVCFLDDDDLFYTNHLEVLVDALNKNLHADAAYSLSHEVESEIQSYTPFICLDKPPRIVFNREFSRGGLFVNNYFPIQSVLFRRKLFEKHGGFNEKLQRLEDWDLWVRYASQSRFVFVDVVTSMYRKPSDPKVVALRNQDHDEYYDLARANQSEITTHFDVNLFDEIAWEIFQRTKISKAFLRIAYNGKLSRHPRFYKICDQRNLDVKNYTYEMSVLDAIKLTSEVVTSHKLLWNFHRAENFIQKKLKKLLAK